jgi:hypothetical protein
MAKCANCTSDALYVYEVTDSFNINYCQYHLPVFLHKLQKSGSLKTTDEFDALKAEALAAVAPKTSKKKVEEETPIVEEVAEPTEGE